MSTYLKYSEGEDDEDVRSSEKTPLLSDSSIQHNPARSSAYSFATILDQQQQQRSILRTTQPLIESTASPLFFKNIQISPEFNQVFSLKKLFKFTGPGLLISVAYLDPGNLDIDLQSGAIAGYKLLWVLFYSILAGLLIQYLSVKLGSVTGFHLAEICHREYGKFTRILLWIMLEISIIASDIQQVIGSALAFTILTHGYIPFWAAILITSCDVFLFLLLETTGIRVLELIFAMFIGVMGASFLYMYIRVSPDQIAVLEGLSIPWCTNCTTPEFNQIVGIVGSIVMPHNIYFHSCLVLVSSLQKIK